MSLSETLNHGAIIPWANMRFNNLTLDGTMIQNWPVGGLFTGQSTTTYGLIRINNVAFNTVYSYSMQTTPNNNAVLFKFGFVCKGGVPGASNNALSREVWCIYQSTNNVVTGLNNFFNAGGAIGFAPASINQNVSNVGFSIQFQLQNNAAGQITDFLWYVTAINLTSTL